MYIHKYKIENCFYYDFHGENILVKSIDTVATLKMYDNDFKSLWTFTAETKLSHIPIIFEDLIFVYENRQTNLLDIKTGQNIGSENRLYLHVDKEYAAYIDVLNSTTIYIKGRSVDSIIESSKSTKFFYPNELIEYPFNKNNILCTDLKTGKLRWKKEMSSLFYGSSVRKYGAVVLVNESIYLYLSDDISGDRATVKIDVATGTLKNVYTQLVGNLFLHQDKIYTASMDRLTILDLSSSQISEYDLSDVLSSHNLQIHWSTYKIADGKLFFIDGGSITTNRLGVIDLKSMNLIWAEEIMVEDNINGNIQEIRISGDKLFVHCSDQSLHIFCFE